MLRVSLMAAAAVIATAGAASAQIGFTTDVLDRNVLQFRRSDTPLPGRMLDASARGTVAPTETYTARLLAQSTAGAGYTDTGVPANYLFDAIAEPAGSSLIGAGDLSITEGVVPISANEFEVIVQLSSVNGADLLPAGITLGSAPANTIRLDIGGVAAAVDPINYVSSDTHAYLYEVGVRVFVDGANIFETTFSPFTPISSPGSIDLSEAWTLSGASGLGIDSVQTFWRIRDVPTPGSLALVAAAGIFGLRRRR